MNRVKKAMCVMLLVTPILGASPVLWASPRQQVTSRPVSVDQGPKPVGQKGQPLDSKKRILSVLDQQLEAQKTFPDENLRIAIQTTIADMLWNFDEPRARRLLEEAFQAIANLKTDERGRPMGLSYIVRNITIRAIATHDPAMALRLQQGVEIPPNIDPKLTGIGVANSLYTERARIQNDLAMYILIGEIRTGDLRHASQA